MTMLFIAIPDLLLLTKQRRDQCRSGIWAGQLIQEMPSPVAAAGDELDPRLAVLAIVSQ